MSDRMPEWEPWPRKMLSSSASAQETAEHYSMMIAFHANRAAYWEARARRAVEALQRINATIDRDERTSRMIFDYDRVEASDALKAIGPLPPENPRDGG